MTEFRGFDTDGVDALAKDLDALARNSGSLHTQLATLMTAVQQNLPPGQRASYDPDLQNLVGDLIPMPFFGHRQLPGSLGGELGDMQASMKRRLAQLKGAKDLADHGYPVGDDTVFLDEKAPDAKRIQDAYDDLHGLGSAHFGITGNQEELQRVSKELDGLTAAELDSVVAKASPQDLADYNRLIGDTGGGLGVFGFGLYGLPADRCRDTVALMLSKVSQDNMAKFTTAFPQVQPDFTNSNAYLNHGNDQNGQTNDGIRWATPTNPLFDDGVSVDDVNQRQFGDCWYMASLAGLAQKDPQFVQDGIRQNPNGTVSVRVWNQGGDYHWVTMTAELPSDRNGTPLSAYGNGETWPAYYEKAFALSYTDEDGNKGYGGIEGDDPKRSAPYLTGHGGEDLETGGFLGIGKHEDMNIDTLRKKFDSGQVITVSSPDDEDLDKNHPASFGGSYVTNHAYYVRGFTGDGKIILGNPWGKKSAPPIEVSQEDFDKYFHNPEAFHAP
ncbi:C2 family cysteine protease [Streptomyces sp. NPDC048664]|uniref:C2 family cysteine protease n=1 Tax=Streptomyces sp. NPDC048664 TaxID=3154505 RepID=UPI0034217F54